MREIQRYGKRVKLSFSFNRALTPVDPNAHLREATLSRCTRSPARGSFYLKDDLTFAIRDHTVTSVGQNVPNTTVITGNVLRGHLATDRQSFVGESLGLTPSFGTGSDGGHFERLCAKTIHGVRTTASADPRPF